MTSVHPEPSVPPLPDLTKPGGDQGEGSPDGYSSSGGAGKGSEAILSTGLNSVTGQKKQVLTPLSGTPSGRQLEASIEKAISELNPSLETVMEMDNAGAATTEAAEVVPPGSLPGEEGEAPVTPAGGSETPPQDGPKARADAEITDDSARVAPIDAASTPQSTSAQGSGNNANEDKGKSTKKFMFLRNPSEAKYAPTVAQELGASSPTSEDGDNSSRAFQKQKPEKPKSRIRFKDLANAAVDMSRASQSKDNKGGPLNAADTAKLKTALKQRTMWRNIMDTVKNSSNVKNVSATADTKVLMSEQQRREEQANMTPEDRMIRRRQMLITYDAVRDGSDLIDPQGKFLDPRSPLRTYWDIVVVIFVIYNVIAIPYYTAFATHIKPDLSREAADYMIDIFFIFDIGINFYTAYYDAFGRLVASLPHIRSEYLRGWFMVDILASFPLELFLLPFNQSTGGGGSQLFAVLKFPRLLRLGRIFKYVEKMKNADVLRIVRLIFMVMLVCHWCACAWYAACEIDRKDSSWCSADATAPDLYLEAYYIALMALIGDNVGPESRFQKGLAIGISLLGSFVLAMVFGNVANLVNHMNAKEIRYQHAMDSRNDIMRYLSMPDNTQERIRQFYEYIWLRFRDMEGGMEAFAQPLPTNLRNEVMTIFHHSLLVKVSFFSKLSRPVLEKIVHNMETVIALPGEVMMKTGELALGLYLISRGSCEVLPATDEETENYLAVNIKKSSIQRGHEKLRNALISTSMRARRSSTRRTSISGTINKSSMENIVDSGGQVGTILRHGDYFGEQCIIDRKPADCTVMALTFTDLHLLTMIAFDMITNEFPDLAVALVTEHAFSPRAKPNKPLKKAAPAHVADSGPTADAKEEAVAKTDASSEDVIVGRKRMESLVGRQIPDTLADLLPQAPAPPSPPNSSGASSPEMTSPLASPVPKERVEGQTSNVLMGNTQKRIVKEVLNNARQSAMVHRMSLGGFGQGMNGYGQMPPPPSGVPGGARSSVAGGWGPQPQGGYGPQQGGRPMDGYQMPYGGSSSQPSGEGGMDYGASTAQQADGADAGSQGQGSSSGPIWPSGMGTAFNPLTPDISALIASNEKRMGEMMEMQTMILAKLNEQQQRLDEHIRKTSAQDGKPSPTASDYTITTI